MIIKEMENFSKTIKNIFDSGNPDKETINKDILYRFFEVLGYTQLNDSISPAGISPSTQEYLFDYGLGILDDTYAKIYIKLVDINSDLNDLDEFKQNIADLVSAQIQNDRPGYFIYTNGFVYKVLKNERKGNNFYNIISERQFNLLEYDKDKQNIDLILKELCKTEKFEDINNNNIINNEEDSENEFEDNYFDDEEDKKEDDNKTNFIENNKNKLLGAINDLKNKDNSNKSILKIILFVIAIIIILLMVKFIFSGNKTDNTETNDTNISNDNNLDNTTNDSSNNNTNTTNSNLKSISAVLDLSVTDEVLSVNIITDLPEASIVKIGIFCGDNKDYKYIKLDNNSKGYLTYDIPNTWGAQVINVGAYLRFDETGYTQPDSLLQIYGDKGENINWNTNYSANMIAKEKVNHSNELVEKLLEQKQQEQAASLEEAMKEDFQNIDTRVDSFGNIKQVPKGFEFDKSNISETRNIYPMIYYDKEKDTSYLYVICGYVGTQILQFSSVSFYADGYGWKYENSTNVKKNNFVGNKKAEWVYFNNIDTPALIEDMKLLSSSEDTTMCLVGSTNKTFNVTTADKNLLTQFIYIYETYYSDGNVLDTSLLDSVKTIDISFLIEPKEMRERDKAEVNSLTEYTNLVSTKKANGETVSKKLNNILKTMNKTYKKIDDNYNAYIWNIISGNSKAEYIETSDINANSNYYKVYCFYNSNGTIEEGYIPYYNISSDGYIWFPITDDETEFVKIDISEDNLTKISNYFSKTKYISF